MVVVAMLLGLGSVGEGAHAADLVTITVTTTADSGLGSLREAITVADLAGEPAAVHFAISGAAPRVVTLVTPLPTVTVPLTIDGRTQPGYIARPVVELRGGGPFTLLSFSDAASGSSVEALAFTRYGTAVTASTALTIERSYVGIHADGTDGDGHPGVAGAVGQGTALQVGGGSAVHDNVLSDNEVAGLVVCGDLVDVERNVVGGDPSAMAAMPNVDGVVLGCPNPSTPTTRAQVGENGQQNTILGNLHAGIVEAGTDDYLWGNFVGMAADWHHGVPNATGILVTSSSLRSTLLNNWVLSNERGIDVEGRETHLDGNSLGTTPYGDRNPTKPAVQLYIGASLARADENSVVGASGPGILVTHDAAAWSDTTFSTYLQQNDVHDNDGDGVRIEDAENGAVVDTAVHANGGAGIRVLGQQTTWELAELRVSGNGGLGIDIGPAGRDAPDDLDADAGPNGMQNAPVVTSVVPHGSHVTVTGALRTLPNARVDVEVDQNIACDTSGFGEAEQWRGGGTTVTTDANGLASFVADVPAPITSGSRWTTIAVTTDGTSELSNCFAMPGARNASFVVSAYEQLIGREPDDAGFAYWFGQLQTGAPRSRLIDAFEHTDEHARLFVEGIYFTILRRFADDSGLAYWSAFLEHGGPTDDLRSLIYGSPEYSQVRSAASDAGFVRAVYQDILGRTPDPAGAAYWQGLLASGMSRAGVARSMLALPEPIAVGVNRWFEQYLHRPAAPHEAAYWSDVWRRDGELAVIAGIIGSDEYYAALPA